jgi:hypothetical protein
LEFIEEWADIACDTGPTGSPEYEQLPRPTKALGRESVETPINAIKAELPKAMGKS